MIEEFEFYSGRSRYRVGRTNVAEDDGIVILSALITERRGIGAVRRGKAVLPDVANSGCECKYVTLNRDHICSRDSDRRGAIGRSEAAARQRGSNRKEMALNGDHVNSIDAI